MNRQSGRTRWLSQVLRSVAVVLAAAVGVIAAAPSPASLVTYAYDTVAYTYDASANLSTARTTDAAVRGPPSGQDAAPKVSHVSLVRFGVAAEAARVAPPPAGGSSASSPTFIGFADGPPAIVPRGASGPTLTRGPGVQYTGGSGGLGLHPNTSGVRIMDQTAHHAPRVVYMNQTGQTINPVTGRTVPKSDPWAHLPW